MEEINAHFFSYVFFGFRYQMSNSISTSHHWIIPAVLATGSGIFFFPFLHEVRTFQKLKNSVSY